MIDKKSEEAKAFTKDDAQNVRDLFEAQNIPIVPELDELFSKIGTACVESYCEWSL